MAYIFNEEKLNEILKRYNIEYDDNAANKYDKALNDLAIAACDDDNWMGAGISRNGFDLGDCVLKVSKFYYVNAYDESAEEEYYDDTYPEDREDYGWAFDCLENLNDSQFIEDQSLNEIRNYVIGKSMRRCNKHYAEIYAATSNGLVELVEKCKEYYSEDYPEKTKKKFKQLLKQYRHAYDDIHSGNIGINKNGDLVIIDLGYEFNWDWIAVAFKSCYNRNTIEREIESYER